MTNLKALHLSNNQISNIEPLKGMSNIECKFCYNYGQLDDIPPVGEGMWEIGGNKFYEKDIETPMTPEFFQGFFKKKQSILDTKVDFINCAELHY